MEGEAVILPWLVAPDTAAGAVPDAASVRELFEEELRKVTEANVTRGRVSRSVEPRRIFRSLCVAGIIGIAVFVCWNSAHAGVSLRSSALTTTEESAAPRRTSIFPKNESCMPARRPGEYGEVSSYPLSLLTACASFATKDIFGTNDEIASMAWSRFANVEVLLIGQIKAAVHYMEVVFKGDLAHYQIRKYTPLQSFGSHSCLDSRETCSVVFTKPIEPGFLMIDRHRVMQYNYTWLPDATDIVNIADQMEYEERVGLIGEMNARVDAAEGPFFPTALAVYLPFNSTHIDETFRFEPRIMPHAETQMILITDTGNERVLILNASAFATFEIIGQFGVTGVEMQNESGFSGPWGIDIYAPAWESRFEPVFANVFVADRRNHRLVKLNLGYPLVPCDGMSSNADEPAQRCRYYDTIRLGYSGEYGAAVGVRDTPQGLLDPTSVVVFRHYILVAEANGHTITMLQVDHQDPDRMFFVTHFTAIPGMSLQGHMVVSEYGFMWYDYIWSDGSNYFASFYLPEDLRLSTKPDRLQDYLVLCVNQSFYDELLLNNSAFFEYMGFVLNASSINWLFSDLPGYVDIQIFNASAGFNLDALDKIVFNGTMESCTLPPTPTAPPLLSGNEEGWAMGGAETQAAYRRGRSGAPRTAPCIRQVLLALGALCILQLLSRP